MNIHEKLMNIQAELKAPKNQFNSFGKYKYRNLEDILEGLKPLLLKYKAIINISDEIVLIGDRYYIKATAILIDVDGETKEQISTTAYAREDENKKGMDLSQLSGSTSSYARKYALNGLFAIDDTKDSDTTNQGSTSQPSKPKKVDAGLASEKQISFMVNLVKQKKYGIENITKYMKEKYNKNSSKELSSKEASAIIKMLNKYKTEEGK